MLADKQQFQCLQDKVRVWFGVFVFGLISDNIILIVEERVLKDRFVNDIYFGYAYCHVDGRLYNCSLSKNIMDGKHIILMKSKRILH